MITINDKTSRTPIFIERDILNRNEKPSNDYVNSGELDEILTGYITEDELQEQLKNIDNIPYIVVDHIQFDDGTWGYGIVSGDFNAVYNAIVERKPQIMYVPHQLPKTFFAATAFGYNSEPKTIWVAVSHHNAVDFGFIYLTFNITEDGVTQTYQSRNVQEKLVSGENIKTINGNDILGEGDIDIDVDLDSKQDKLVSGTNIKTINNTSVLGSGNIAVQPSLVSGNNIKTINGSSLLGSGDITIVGSGSEILYLYKATDDTAIATHKNHNINIRNKILSLTSTEQYPIIILKDWYNDTICNNVYAKDNYVEIQCCNSRIFGEYSELTDERYELNNKGVLVKLEGNTFASKAYVDEQVSNVSGGGGSTDLSNYYTKGEIDNMVGDIETILDNLIGNN